MDQSYSLMGPHSPSHNFLAWFALQAVCLLCGFLAVTPPVYSISCYRKVVEDGDQVFIDDGVVHCKGPDQDKCGTLAFTVDSVDTVLIKNCTRSALDCDHVLFVRGLEKKLNILVAALLRAHRCAVKPINVTRQVGRNRDSSNRN